MKLLKTMKRSEINIVRRSIIRITHNSIPVVNSNIPKNQKVIVSIALQIKLTFSIRKHLAVQRSNKRSKTILIFRFTKTRETKVTLTRPKLLRMKRSSVDRQICFTIISWTVHMENARPQKVKTHWLTIIRKSKMALKIVL